MDNLSKKIAQLLLGNRSAQLVKYQGTPSIGVGEQTAQLRTGNVKSGAKSER